MSFVNPTYLWAFLGLLVPIAIHLWSNKEGKVIKVGSIKFLENSESSQSKSIKLNEYLLLFLRLLLLSFLVLILAEPQLKQKPKNTSLTYVIEPSLLKNNTVKTITSNLKSKEEARIFVENFPEVEDYEENNSTISNYWQLIQQIESLPTDSVVVFTRGHLSGIKGKRPIINKPVKWIVIEDESTLKDKPIIAFKEENQISLLKTNSSASHLSFSNQKIALNSSQIEINPAQDSLIINNKTIPLNHINQTHVLVFYDEEFQNQLHYLEASLKAIEKYTEQTIQIKKAKDINGLNLNDYSLVIWLSNQPKPKAETKILEYIIDDLAPNIIEESEKENVFHLTKELSTKLMLENDFVNQLFRILYDNRIDDSILNGIDKRVISEPEIQTNFNVNTIEKRSSQQKKNYAKWLWIPFLFVLILERVVSKVRKQ